MVPNMDVEAVEGDEAMNGDLPKSGVLACHIAPTPEDWDIDQEEKARQIADTDLNRQHKQVSDNVVSCVRSHIEENPLFHLKIK
jgi:hypothetical protein